MKRVSEIIVFKSIPPFPNALWYTIFDSEMSFHHKHCVRVFSVALLYWEMLSTRRKLSLGSRSSFSFTEYFLTISCFLLEFVSHFERMPVLNIILCNHIANKPKFSKLNKSHNGGCCPTQGHYRRSLCSKQGPVGFHALNCPFVPEIPGQVSLIIYCVFICPWN